MKDKDDKTENACEYNVFDVFEKQWALVTAGGMAHFNSCTIGWGSFGNMWGHAGKRKSIPTVTVYIHPARYTSEFLQSCETFTVSFYPEKYRKALAYMGSHSGRDGDKAAIAGLTPVAIGECVTYKEANLTFLCKKLYQHQFAKDDLAPEIKEYYASMPAAYPDFQGGWQPHIVFIGEVLSVEGSANINLPS